MSDNSLNPGLNYFDNASKQVKFDGNCLKQENLLIFLNLLNHLIFWNL